MNLETMKYATQRGLRRVGVDAARIVRGDGLSEADRRTVRTVERYTMTPPERVVALTDAVRYLTRANIAGDIVECGVWRGGSMMAAARTLLEEGDTSRDLFLYDTFAGMTDPTAEDRDTRGRSATKWMRRYGVDETGNSKACNATLEDVTANMALVGYPPVRCHYVKGPVEETLPETLPGPIALLRLDTDWYESTAHEMEHLFPLIVPGGVLIVDDYGHWEGSQQAVDEYLAKRGIVLLLHRTDYAGRVALLPNGGGV
jgi:hypothetical protein